jgi:hypothetical protein
MLIMYLIGIVAAFVMAWVFKKTLLRSETPMLLLEMPPYRMPSWKSVALRMWERAGLFLRRAGTVILALSILLWALLTYPKPDDPKAGPAEAIAHSIGGHMGHALEPLIAPLGYDWKIGIGLIGSFAAREVFVGTMGIVYDLESVKEDTEPLQAQLRAEQRDQRPRRGQEADPGIRADVAEDPVLAHLDGDDPFALAEMRTEVFDHALTVPVDLVERAGTGDLVSRVTSDITILADAVRNSIPVVLLAALEVVFTMGALVLLDIRLAAIALLTAIPITFAAGRWYFRRAHMLYRRERERTAALGAGLPVIA